MKNSLEIRLKEQKEPTIWERLVQWLHGKANAPVPQLPKTGTHTDILLSQSQKLQLKQAVESPIERSSDSTFYRKSESGQDSLII